MFKVKLFADKFDEGQCFTEEVFSEEKVFKNVDLIKEYLTSETVQLAEPRLFERETPVEHCLEITNADFSGEEPCEDDETGEIYFLCMRVQIFGKEKNLEDLMEDIF